MFKQNHLTIRYSSGFDQSGYGTAATNMCNTMLTAGIDLITNIMYTPMSRHEVSKCKANDRIFSLHSPDKKAAINICEQVPILWEGVFQKGSYNIGRMYWETDKLPAQWIDIINDGLCNEVWASCKWNKDVYIDSGVKKPVYVIPPVNNFECIAKESAEDILSIGGNFSAYRFYSIFQWTERKNPEGLLRAYFNEFGATDNVILVLKVYGASASVAEKRVIKETILVAKEKSGNPNPPPIYLFGDLLNPEQLNAIHAQCSAIVMPHRGEGWSVPITDAMGYGNQIITTRLGGITDSLDDSSAYIIPHQLKTVGNMPWSQFYTLDQKWGHIEDKHIQVAMRNAFNERNNFSHKSNKYQEILELSSKETVIKLIKERITNILM